MILYYKVYLLYNIIRVYLYYYSISKILPHTAYFDIFMDGGDEKGILRYSHNS